MTNVDEQGGEDGLTDAERMLLERLPRPPSLAKIHTTSVWIIEWLSPEEQHTGRLLHEWIHDRRPGWSAYRSCRSKAQVIQAILEATVRARTSQMVPVLHLETHGGKDGLAPDRVCSEFLTWDELTVPLQQLNMATGCNLVVFVVACTGFAGIQALTRGPRAPALALVGPDATVMPSHLLLGAKEFYRRWQDKNASLAEIAESASREAGTVAFEWEPFALIAYDALVERLVMCCRRAEGRLNALPPASALQQVWDEMFMIDLYPNNRERFGLDMRAITEFITEAGPGLANGR